MPDMRDKKVLICVLALAVGVFGSIGWIIVEREWERRSGESELAAATAACDATDPNWRWDKLSAALPKPPAGQNGTDLAKKVLEDLPPDWVEEPEQKRTLKEVSALPANAAPPENTLEAVRRLVTRAGPAVAVTRKFKDTPTGLREPAGLPKSPPGDTDVRDTSLTLLHLDSLLADDRRDPERVAGNLLAALNISRSIGQDPFLSYQALRCRLRVTATAQLERALATSNLGNSLDRLQAAWAAEAEEPLLRYAILGERAYYSDLTDRLAKGDPTALEEAKHAGAEDSAARFASWRQRATVPGDHATFLRWMGKAAEAARQPAEQQVAAFKAFPPVEQTRELALSHPRTSAVLTQAPQFWASTALLRCAATGVACERFRLVRGKWPDALDALSPEFLPVVPLDPFDGAPLKYTKRPDGVTISATGPSGEIAFRLWNPDARPKPSKSATSP